MAEILTDELGEYRLNSYGSKERPSGKAWVLRAEDMSQAEIDARAALAEAQAIEEQARKDSAKAAGARIKSLLGIPTIADTKQLLKDIQEVMGYLDDLQ